MSFSLISNEEADTRREKIASASYEKQKVWMELFQRKTENAPLKLSNESWQWLKDSEMQGEIYFSNENAPDGSRYIRIDNALVRVWIYQGEKWIAAYEQGQIAVGKKKYENRTFLDEFVTLTEAQIELSS